MLTVSGTETASSAIARGGLINTTLVASANNDFLVGLDVAPTFTNGAFTGVQNIAIRSSGTFKFTGLGAIYGSSSATNVIFGAALDLSATTFIRFFASGGTQVGQMFNTTGNFILQNGGTFTDAGFRLDVNGTTRLQSDALINGLTVGRGAGNVASNTAIGASAGSANTTGSNNTFIGLNAGRDNTTGTINSAIGAFALSANTTGSNNNACGYGSLFNFISGNNNTGLGQLSLNALQTGSNNIGIGTNAGSFFSTGTSANNLINNSIYIGYESRSSANNQSNQIVIGHQTVGLGSNTTVIGNSSTTITGLYGNIRLVSGMGTAPASSTATGTTGDIVVTAGFIYVCTATNTWVRTALTTW
jgi:hypothetical protein